MLGLVGLFEVLLGMHCIQCERPGSSWCAQCLRCSFAPQTWMLPDGRVIVAAASYQSTVASAIVAHKERGQLRLARPLGQLLAQSVQRLLGPARSGRHLTLVPCPSSPDANRERGQDHGLRLARAAARALRKNAVPVSVSPALRAARPMIDQVGLSPRERLANADGAFVARSVQASAREVIVVDDVTTTGATLREADRALRRAGWRVRGCAVIAMAGAAANGP